MPPHSHLTISPLIRLNTVPFSSSEDDLDEEEMVSYSLKGILFGKEKEKREKRKEKREKRKEKREKRKEKREKRNEK